MALIGVVFSTGALVARPIVAQADRAAAERAIQRDPGRAYQMLLDAGCTPEEVVQEVSGPFAEFPEFAADLKVFQKRISDMYDSLGVDGDEDDVTPLAFDAHWLQIPYRPARQIARDRQKAFCNMIARELVPRDK